MISSLKEYLCGKLIENVPLGEQSWFRCGGSADLLFEPVDIDDLAKCLEVWPKSEPLMIIGSMANMIIRDGGVRGLVVRLGKAFADIEVSGTCLMVGAGALNGSVASAAAKVGIGGLEFLSGIPGTIGGALRMNAGAYGAEVKDIFVEAHALDRQGHKQMLKPETMGFAYRRTKLSEDYIFTHALFEGHKEEREIVRARLKEIKIKRNTTQPIKESTGGSTFANPKPKELKAAGLPEDLRVWQVVEKLGGRGLKIGGAQMSEKHCNFMINTGNASAADLEALGEELRKRATDQFGLTLHWEIKRIGES